MFTNLVLSGAGIAGITYFGCLKYLNENQELKKNIKNILGVSSGSIFSLFLLFDITYVECIKWLEKIKTMNLNNIKLKNFLNVQKDFGLDSSEGIIDAVKSIYDMRNILYDTTFTDISKKFGKNLIIATANITTRDLFYFSINSTPNVKVLDAIKASTSIPLIFTPFKYDNELHVDAFIYDNFPMNYFKNSLDHTFGLNLYTENIDPINISSYLESILASVVIFHAKKQHINECLVSTNGHGFNFKKMNFDLNDCDINTQIDKGYNTLKAFIEEKVRSFQQTQE